MHQSFQMHMLKELYTTQTQSEPYAEAVEEAVEFVQNNPHYDVFGD